MELYLFFILLTILKPGKYFFIILRGCLFMTTLITDHYRNSMKKSYFRYLVYLKLEILLTAYYLHIIIMIQRDNRNKLLLYHCRVRSYFIRPESKWMCWGTSVFYSSDVLCEIT